MNHCPTPPLQKMNRYAYSKMMAEQAVIKANGPTFSTCALRLVGMYGPGDKYHLAQCNQKR